MYNYRYARQKGCGSVPNREEIQRKLMFNECLQCAKKVLCDSVGLVDFAIWLVIFVLNLPNGQVMFFGEIQITRRIVINPANQKGFSG